MKIFNIMKNIGYITALTIALLPLATGCTESDGIRLDFEVTSPVSGTVVVVCHTDIHELPLDSLGHASCTITDTDAAFMKIFYGTESRLIYAEDGDTGTISFDGNDMAGTFRFEGKKAPAVEYLNSMTLNALPDQDYGLPFDEFAARLKAKTEDASVLLEARDLKGTGNFRKMEDARIRYAYGIQLLMYPMAHRVIAQDPGYRPDEAYYDVIRSYFKEDPMYADIDEYREFMTESAHILDPEGRETGSLYPKLVAEMKYISTVCSDEKVRQVLLHHIAVPYIDNFGTDGTEDMANIYRTYVTDPVLVAGFEARCDKWDRKKPGKPSPDFEASGIDGKVRTLEDFRGKYVYIDVWATWCQPCMRELPHLKELEKKFEGRGITFLGLSIDSDRQKWEEKIRSGELSGVQLYLGDSSDFLTAYGIRSIPRFILLDKEGNIINSRMTRPSSGDTGKVLSALEGI